jgi:hypothetical protein
MLRFLSFFALFLSVLCLGAFAVQAENPYIVRNIVGDAIAKSSVEARKKAFEQAQIKAYDQLLSRFLSEDERANFQKADPKKIASLVRDFEVTNERISSRRYVAIYTIRFKEQATRAHFGSGPLSNADTDSAEGREYIVFPFFEQNGHVFLWTERQNPFLKAWRSHAAQASLSYLIPSGDDLDKMDVREAQGFQYNHAGLNRIRNRYKSDKILVLLARYERNKNPPVTVQIFEAGKRKSTLLETLEFTVESEKTLGQLMQNVVAKLEKHLLDTLEKPEPEIVPNVETVPDFNKVYQQSIANNVPPESKVQPQTTKAQPGQIRVRVRFNSMAEWMGLRSELQEIPAVTSLRIAGLRSSEADIDLAFSDWISLQNALRAKNFDLSASGATYFLIKR